MELRNTKVISRIFLLTAALLLFGLSGVSWASDIKVSLAVPNSVVTGVPFNISITVTNDSNSPISFNRVAVGYTLQDLKFRGPYEVDTTTHNVLAKNSITFSVPFRISFGTGVVVPLAVILANGSYTKQSIIGGEVAGIMVNSGQ